MLNPYFIGFDEIYGIKFNFLIVEIGRNLRLKVVFLQTYRGRTGFDSIWYGWCKHAVRWIISTLI